MRRLIRIPQSMRLGAALFFVMCIGTTQVHAQVSGTAPTDSEQPPAADGANRDTSPSKAQCLEAHQQTQQMQNTHRLVEAQGHARTCVYQGCPGPIVADCAQWLLDLDQRVPSVVFEVRLDGRHATSATVAVDGEPVREWTRGEALRLNPGEHRFHFELAKNPPIDETVVVAEGMRYRVISADFKTQAPTSPNGKTPADKAPREGTNRPVPWVVYPLLGLSLAGFAGFAGFAAAGKAAQSDLERTCAPRCADDDLSTMRQRYLFGDIAMGLGVGALVGAGVVYLARPTASASSSPVMVGILPGGAAATFTHRF